jgi:transcriptional regulator with XRE-family HTH domain
MARPADRLFPALLRDWRARRGMSQLDLALAADVSSRHVSFLETGRSEPSREMVLRLAGALNVPLRGQNALLRAAGFEEAFSEPSVRGEMPAPISAALDRMFAAHEPFPVVAFDRRYDILRTNAGASRVFARFFAEPTSLGHTRANIFDLLFDPRALRPFVVDWPLVARALLVRLHREALSRAGDGELAALVTHLLDYPDVPASWRQPDFAAPSEPVFTLRLNRGPLRFGFLAAITSFSAPQNVTLEEIRIETYFPLDGVTAEGCEALRRDDGG